MLKKMGAGFILFTLMFVVASPAWSLGGQDLKGMEIVIGNYWEDYDADKGSCRSPLIRSWRKNRPPPLSFWNRHGL